jgi:hypothetical protein
VFNPYVTNRTTELSALMQSGIMEASNQFDTLASAAAETVNMPFWGDLTGDDEVLADDGALTPGKIQASKDVAVILRRGRAWGANDLAANLAGSDPAKVIGDLVAAYWARRQQAILVKTLTGAFAAASMSGNLHDISGAGDGNDEISASRTVDAAQKLGDAKSGLVGICMHSAVEAYLAKQDLIDVYRDSEGKIQLTTFMGKRVIVDDGCPVSNGVYDTYLFGPGAVAFGNGSPVDFVPTETDRDSLAGEDYLINRKTWVLHPRGIKWKGNAAGASPTNTELTTGTNWERVWENKQIRIILFRHKI